MLTLRSDVQRNNEIRYLIQPLCSQGGPLTTRSPFRKKKFFSYFNRVVFFANKTPFRIPG